jgi:hypothetical protein
MERWWWDGGVISVRLGEVDKDSFFSSFFCDCIFSDVLEEAGILKYTNLIPQACQSRGREYRYAFESVFIPLFISFDEFDKFSLCV